MKKDKNYEITPQGSLGILALGDVGIRKWRAAVQQQNELPVKKKKKK
jgi:hypothetical protein